MGVACGGDPRDAAPSLVGAEEKLAAFVAGLSRLDSASPVTGLYLVGSHALGDVTPESDIDFLAVLRPSPLAGEVTALAVLHDQLSESWPEPHLDGHYVTAGDLCRPPRTWCPSCRTYWGRGSNRRRALSLRFSGSNCGRTAFD